MRWFRKIQQEKKVLYTGKVWWNTWLNSFLTICNRWQGGCLHWLRFHHCWERTIRTHRLLRLHHCAATGGRVVVWIDFKFISIDKVNVRFPFPRVGHFGDRDQFDSLTLDTQKSRHVTRNNRPSIEHQWRNDVWVNYRQLQMKMLKNELPVEECERSGRTCPGVRRLNAVRRSPQRGPGTPSLDKPEQGHRNCITIRCLDTVSVC